MNSNVGLSCFLSSLLFFLVKIFIFINKKLALEALQLPLLARHEVSQWEFKFPNLKSSRFFSSLLISRVRFKHGKAWVQFKLANLLFIFCIFSFSFMKMVFSSIIWMGEGFISLISFKNNRWTIVSKMEKNYNIKRSE